MSSLSDAVRTNGISAFVGDSPGLDVDVVEDLEVIRDEADRAHHHPGVAGCGAGGDHLPQVGAEPGLGGPPRPLPGHRPTFEAGFAGHAAAEAWTCRE